MKTDSLESQYSKTKEWGRQRSGRDLKGNLLTRLVVPESTPNQHVPTCDPLLSSSQHSWCFAVSRTLSLGLGGPVCSLNVQLDFITLRMKNKPSSHLSWTCSMHSWHHTQKALLHLTAPQPCNELGLSELGKAIKPTQNEYITAQGNRMKLRKEPRATLHGKGWLGPEGLDPKPEPGGSWNDPQGCPKTVPPWRAGEERNTRFCFLSLKSY